MPQQFKKTIARIVAGATSRPGDGAPARPVAPESFGWLRRSDLDQTDREAWELPDGEIRLTGRDEGQGGIPPQQNGA